MVESVWSTVSGSAECKVGDEDYVKDDKADGVN